MRLGKWQDSFQGQFRVRWLILDLMSQNWSASRLVFGLELSFVQTGQIRRLVFRLEIIYLFIILKIYFQEVSFETYGSNSKG